MVAGVHPVGIHGAEVLNLKLEQGAGELLGIAELLSEGISLELKLAAEDIHAKLNNKIHGRKCVREKNEANDDGVLGKESKGRVERVVVDEDREKSEDVKQVSLKESQSCSL